MNRFRYAAKRILGPALTHRIATWKQAIQRQAARSTARAAASDPIPWCSPNTFSEIVASYRRVPSPYVHEYGAGESTLWHLRELVSAGGTLIAVEHDSEWAEYVRTAAFEILQRPPHRTGAATAGNVATTVVHNGSVADVEYLARAANGAEVRFALRVRPPILRSTTGDGTADEFHEYIHSLDRPADMVIIDGRARKACIRHVLDKELLRPGGAIALFEAGRGVEGWLDAPALKGTSNYQPEVQRLMTLGAHMIDGTGYDTWPAQLGRRTFGSLSKHYPLELCLLQLPEGMGIGATRASRDRSI